MVPLSEPFASPAAVLRVGWKSLKPEYKSSPSSSKVAMRNLSILNLADCRLAGTTMKTAQTCSQPDLTLGSMADCFLCRLPWKLELRLHPTEEQSRETLGITSFTPTTPLNSFIVDCSNTHALHDCLKFLVFETIRRGYPDLRSSTWQVQDKEILPAKCRYGKC